MLQSVKVRKLETVAEVEQAKLLEEEIWQSESLPLHQTLATIENGGFLIGAFLQEELIGISFSFPGYKNEELYLYSHLLGIKKKYREMGVGELLKLEQKEIALENGYSKCVWIFDPLEAYVGYLYFSRLQAYSCEYIENTKADLDKYAVNSVTPDRLLVEWFLNEADDYRYAEQIDEFMDDASDIVEWTLTNQGLPILDEEKAFSTTSSYKEDAYFLPIPKNFKKLKVEAQQLAEDWRLKTREIFRVLFDQGYAIVYMKQGKEHICRYLLVKKTLISVG